MNTCDDFCKPHVQGQWQSRTRLQHLIHDLRLVTTWPATLTGLPPQEQQALQEYQGQGRRRSAGSVLMPGAYLSLFPGN